MNAIVKNFRKYQWGEICNYKLAEKMREVTPSIEPLHEACKRMKDLFNGVAWSIKMNPEEAISFLEDLLVEKTGLDRKLVKAYVKCAFWHDNTKECNFFFFPSRGQVGAKYLTL